VGKTVYLPPPSLVSTGASTLELLNLTKARAMFTVPSTLEEMTLLADNQGVSALVSLQFVAFGGGRLKPSVGEALSAAGVRLLNHYGTTETGSLSVVYVPEPADWSYFRLRDDIDLTIESVETAEDGMTQQYKLVARPFGWDREFEIQDQLVRNPKHPTTDFTTVGRNDALIVLATGKKVLPDLLESMLSEAKNVKAAIAYGEGQFELVVLIEPSVEVSPEDLDNFKTSLWPIIEEAGNGMEAHARIASKDAVIVIPHGRSFPRSDKASIMRKEVYRVFDSEITETYRVLDSLESDAAGPKFSLGDGALEQELKNLIQTQLNWRIPPDEWGITDDLFELGMDSLQALHLRRLILRQLPARDDQTPWIDLIPREFVYMRPSVAELAMAIRQEDQPNGIKTPTKERLIEQLVQEYSLTTKVIVPNGVGNGLNSGHGSISGNVILLTGATGSLGSQLLSRLVGLEETFRVICLNRVSVSQGPPEHPLDRQRRSLKSRGISISEGSWRKVSVFETNTSAPLLGLGQDQYADLKRTVTHIIHNAWPMDFKRQILSFKPQFSTIQNFLTLCRDVYGTTHQIIKPTLVFVSSIAVVGQYSAISGERIVPEKPMADSRSTNAFGYAEGKLVGEKILEYAASVYSKEMSVKYVRCGQIAGSKDSGCWSTAEYFPALVKSSQAIGALPVLEGVRQLQLPRLTSPRLRFSTLTQGLRETDTLLAPC
jgi:nucleoside-diphosphate-sugar epimerase